MDKEDFYEILVAFAERTKEDYHSKFEVILDSLEIDEELKEKFNKMIG
jgi:hypothetical protein